jgi:hypothetical protein
VLIRDKTKNVPGAVDVFVHQEVNTIEIDVNINRHTSQTSFEVRGRFAPEAKRSLMRDAKRSSDFLLP